MRLIPNAGAVALRSWSLWANRAGFASLILPNAVYVLTGVDLDPIFWAWVGVVLYIAAELLRYLDQGGLDGRRDTFWTPPWVAVLALLAVLALPGMGSWPDATEGREPPGIEAVQGPPIEAEWAAVAVPLVAKWEGLRTEAYLDTIAVPPLPTVCYGETKGVKMGDRYTPEECAAKLRKRLVEYRVGWHGYLTPVTLQQRLTPERDAAFTSLAYNVGIAGAGGSTATRRLNAGEIRAACEAIGWWNRAGQRVIRGLVNRRAEETALCLKGVL